MAILLIVLISVAALIVGTLAHLMPLVWIALGLSLIGLALIVARSVLRRRRAAKPDDHDDEPADDTAEDAVEDAVEIPSPPSTVDEIAEVAEAEVEVAEVTDVSAVAGSVRRTGTATLVVDRTEQLVRVVAGRRRYHQADCGLLGSHTYAEITRAEADDEGFTACTKCCG